MLWLREARLDRNKTMPPPGGKPFQSKLIPFAEEIRALRRQRKSYVEIARLLAERGIHASPSTVFAFVKVRSKRRHLVTMLDSSSHHVRPTLSDGAIEALKRRPSPSPIKPVFDFDENKPLTFKPK